LKKSRLPKNAQTFSATSKEVWKAFQELGDECHKAGPLDDRTRRLIKIGIAAAAQSEGAVHSAVRQARDANISDEEIRHAIILSITTIGFPRAMAAMSWAQDILKE
jgi:alkylhydroperoxidase/carboxymuconolactone decarboxylase family protein YurZ